MNSPDLFIQRGAVISACRLYRYILWRMWDNDLPVLLFIGLNPSKADEHYDDHTIKRVIGFTRKWGYGGFYMGNLFAFRSTDPDGLKRTPFPVSEVGSDKNDQWLKEAAANSQRIVFAWGGQAGISHERYQEVIGMFPEAWCLGRTAFGHPRHPLFMPLDAELEPFPKELKIAKI